jgi:uncharacterized Tic20 family protein
MTSYASQPTPGWPTSGQPGSLPGEALPPGDDQEPAPGGEGQTGPHAEWQTATGQRWQGEAADSPPGPAGAPPPDREQQADWPADQAPAHEQWARRLADQARGAADISPPQVRRAVLSYLGIPFLGFLPALAVYLITPRASGFVRRHAAQALNLSITLLLYNISAVILGGLLALDTVTAAVLITVPLLAALWIVTLVYLVLAAVAAGRGEDYRIPGWLCATLLR